ncbi:MAG: GNAT family N-acetyltransferase [Actinomycetota bacterium]
MTRTRSEYRLDQLDDLPAAPTLDRLTLRPPVDDDRSQLAGLLLDAYRGTIDDEGEDGDDALAAIDEYRERIQRDWSVVAEDAGRPVAMCFVVEVDGIRYVDPIAVAPSHKRRGLGGDLVLTVLHRLHEAGTERVGAVITDGNTPSQRLFTGLGFVRVGSWGS